MSRDGQKPKPRRYTLAPLYLAAGLFVCYLVLTRMVPAMQSVTADDSNRSAGGWSAVALELSNWVRGHAEVTITLFVLIAIGGVVVPILFRPARLLVWIAAIAIFLFDVALAGAGYWNMLNTLMREANQVVD